jgi:hypothetical protein
MLASLAATLSMSSKSSCHLLALADDVLELVSILQLLFQLFVLVEQRLLLDRLSSLSSSARRRIGFSRKSKAPPFTASTDRGCCPDR